MSEDLGKEITEEPEKKSGTTKKKIKSFVVSDGFSVVVGTKVLSPGESVDIDKDQLKKLMDKGVVCERKG